MKRRDVWGPLATLSAATAAHAADSSGRHSRCPATPSLTTAGAAASTEHGFLDMVNQELRSPLQRLVTATESASRNMTLGASRAHNTAALHRIRRAIWGLQSQLRDLLTVARGDASEPGKLLETFDCSQLVRDVCAEIEDAAWAKGLSLSVTLPNQPQVVHADPIRIAQVLRNLLQNAVLQTSAGGVEVNLLAPASDGASSSTGWMRFTVSDSGTGIPTKAISRLRSEPAPFEPCGDPPPQSLQTGLFVVRDVLRDLNGHIEVSSASDQAMVVSVQIPVPVPADALDTDTDADAKAVRENDDGGVPVDWVGAGGPSTSWRRFWSPHFAPG